MAPLAHGRRSLRRVHAMSLRRRVCSLHFPLFPISIPPFPSPHVHSCTMVPDPPPTPRLNSLLSGFQVNSDPLWGTSSEATAILAQVQAWLASKNASLQPISDVPLIYSQAVMEHFGFTRRDMRKPGSFKYLCGWPQLTIPRKNGRLAPVRGRKGWGVHPALSFR